MLIHPSTSTRRDHPLYDCRLCRNIFSHAPCTSSAWSSAAATSKRDLEILKEMETKEK